MSNKQVLTSLTELLLFQGSATLSQLTSVADLPKLQVLKVLNQNKEFIKISKSRPKRILKILYEDYINSKCEEAFNEGITWKKERIYGGLIVIKCKNPDTERLKERIVIHLGGKVNRTREIKYSRENIESMEILGVIPEDHFKKGLPTMRNLWKE